MEVIYKLLLFVAFKSGLKCYHTNTECGRKESLKEEASCKKTGYKERICEPSFDTCVTTVLLYSTDEKIVNRYCGTEFEKHLCHMKKSGPVIDDTRTNIITKVTCNYCKKDLCNGKHSAAAKISNVGHIIKFFLFLLFFK